MKTQATLLAVVVLMASSAAAAVPLGAETGPAGAQMPDPKQMSGIPLPVGDLAPGTVTVRVASGAITNVIANQAVELSGGPSLLTAKTNASGRAEFSGLRPGMRVRAATTVRGERIESQEFTVPASGGIRLALVATDPEQAKRAEQDRQLAQGPAESGPVVLGERSRFVVEIGDEALNVFNMFDVLNRARVPVRPAQPLVFELPLTSIGAGMLEGSSPQATLADKRVTVSGPFAPGSTVVQFGYSLPITGGTLTLHQKLPAELAQFSVMAQKVGDIRLESPQMVEHREMPLQDQIFIVGKGPALKAGDTVSLTFTGLPHPPVWPRNVALALAAAIVAAGAWGSTRLKKPGAADEDRLRRLEARRDRLFAELTSIEEQHREHSIDPERHATRRRELVSALERVYAEMDAEAAA
jgi:hypothetical protein